MQSKQKLSIFLYYCPRDVVTRKQLTQNWLRVKGEHDNHYTDLE